MSETFYDILGITPKAPPEVIVAVYRAWMKALRVHPDLGGDEELAKRINAAYDVIKDPQVDAVIITMETNRHASDRRR